MEEIYDSSLNLKKSVNHSNYQLLLTTHPSSVILYPLKSIYPCNLGKIQLKFTSHAL